MYLLVCQLKPFATNMSVLKINYILLMLLNQVFAFCKNSHFAKTDSHFANEISHYAKHSLHFAKIIFAFCESFAVCKFLIIIL